MENLPTQAGGGGSASSSPTGGLPFRMSDLLTRVEELNQIAGTVAVCDTADFVLCTLLCLCVGGGTFLYVRHSDLLTRVKELNQIFCLEMCEMCV